MKRFLTGCFILLILYIMAYDLKIGTLPRGDSTAASAPVHSSSHPNYSVYTIKAGETVLSVTESLQKGKAPLSIQRIVADFQSLNPNVSPERLKIGSTYKFPIYNHN